MVVVVFVLALLALIGFVLALVPWPYAARLVPIAGALLAAAVLVATWPALAGR